MARIMSVLKVTLLVGLLASMSGCSSGLFHDLQPHRLWRLNRGPAPGRGALYSVVDDVPIADGEELAEFGAKGTSLDR